MKILKIVSFSAFLTSICFSLVAKPPVVPIDELYPLQVHQKATRLITHVVSNYHYRNVAIDDALSLRIFEGYLKTLDPMRMYLTQQDIADFNVEKTFVDDYLRSSNIAPLFEIFARFRTRLNERVTYAKQTLESEFDFNIEETADFARAEKPWPINEDELNELWRKRVKNDVLSLRLAGKKDAAEIRETLRKRYESLHTRTAQLTNEDIFQIVINAYTNAVDPHTSYFSPRTSENFKIRMSLSLEGIGAVLQNEHELTTVREIVPGGPADLGGALHAEDRIIGIGQGAEGELVDVIGWRLDDVVDLIRGPKNTVVRLQILPKGVRQGGPTETIKIIRNTIKLEEQAAQGSVIEVKTTNSVLPIGVIEVPTFYIDFEARSEGIEDYRSTTSDVHEIIDGLIKQNVRGIIIDLRANGGGSLSEATGLSGLFIDSGPIVQVQNSRGRTKIEMDPSRDALYEGPLVVLVDRNSASASEIFAGAMQDYRRALVIGEPTFGKGTVQNLIDLNRFDRSSGGKLGQLKTTIAQFFRVNGQSTQNRGVEPDIILPTTVSMGEHGESSLENALPWTSIRPAYYTPLDLDSKKVNLVRDLHKKRIATDPAFVALLETEQAIFEEREKTELSLLESDRISEYENIRKEQLKRENQIRTAQGLAPLSSLRGEEELAEKEDDEDELMDVVLEEAGRILADYIESHELAH